MTRKHFYQQNGDWPNIKETKPKPKVDWMWSITKLIAGTIICVMVVISIRYFTLPWSNRKELKQLETRFDAIEETQKKLQERIEITKKFGSLGYRFSKIGESYGLDPKLLPAMAQLESQMCEKIIPNTNNCFGYNKGFQKFNSYEEGAGVVARQITTSPYYEDFQRTGSIDDLGKIYAEDPLWATKVKRIMKQV